MRNNSFIFKSHSILENNTTFNKKIYLRDYCITYFYKPNGNSLYIYEHVIYISPFHINKIINSSHQYFDGTYIFSSDFSQILIVLYYDKETNKKLPATYILFNNKYEKSYIKVFTEFKNIIIIEGEKEFEMISYSSDYELHYLMIKKKYSLIKDI